MANFFSRSGADDQRPDSSHLSGGDNFFSFKNDENSGGSFFGDSSSSVGGGDRGSFFRPSGSGASKNEGSFLDFDGSSTEAEPTFLAPFSRTPPRKRQNQGPPPTPVSQPPPQHSAGVAKMECSYASSPQLVKGDANSSLVRPSRSAVPGMEPAPAAPSSNSRTFEGGALASPAQQNSNTQNNAASFKGFNEVNSQSTCSTQQHGPGISFDGQVGPVEELQKSSNSFDEHRQQSKEMSSSMMFESKCGVEVMSHKVGKEEKFQDTTMALGRMGGSIGEVKSGGQPMGPTGAHVQGDHLVGEGKGLLQQLLAKQMQCLAVMLTPEFEKAMKKEERLLKELEQVEQEGKAYMQELEGMKERFGGRLGQISGFLGLNTKK